MKLLSYYQYYYHTMSCTALRLERMDLACLVRLHHAQLGELLCARVPTKSYVHLCAYRLRRLEPRLHGRPLLRSRIELGLDLIEFSP